MKNTFSSVMDSERLINGVFSNQFQKRLGRVIMAEKWILKFERFMQYF